jgi:hypothetical protein
MGVLRILGKDEEVRDVPILDHMTPSPSLPTHWANPVPKYFQPSYLPSA